MELKTIITDAYLFVATFRDRIERGHPPSLEEMLQEVRNLFAVMDQKVLSDSVLRSRYDRIRFGLVALIDEVIVTSTWEHAPAWPTMEMEFYNTRVAGNVFYDFLRELTPADKDLIQASFYILTLGFRGMYAFEESRWEEQVLNLYRQLPDPLEDEPFRLTPAAYHVIKKKAKKLDPIFSLGRSLIVFIATMLLLVVFYQVVWTRMVSDVQQKTAQAKAQITDEVLKSSLEGKP